MKTYRGYRLFERGADGEPVSCRCIVNVHVQQDGKMERSYPLDPRHDLRNHSPTGFEWTYRGSGPAQLALALVADCCGDALAVARVYQRLKERIVAILPRDGWTLTEEQVKACVEEVRKEAGA